MYINTIKEDAKKLEPVSFQWCPSGNGHKLKNKRLSVKKHLFSVKVTDHWNKLPKDIGKSPALDVLKST